MLGAKKRSPLQGFLLREETISAWLLPRGRIAEFLLRSGQMKTGEPTSLDGEHAASPKVFPHRRGIRRADRCTLYGC